MPTVDFTLRNKNYSIACDAGEEERIKKLAEKLSVRVDAMSQSFSAASDNVVLAFTALMIEDEVDSIRSNISNNNEPVNNTPDMLSEAEQADRINNALINAIEPIAEYVENLAKKIENR